MALHPHVQGRAQVEFNTAFGLSLERLPCFADRPKTPYVNAVVKDRIPPYTALRLKRSPEMHAHGAFPLSDEGRLPPRVFFAQRACCLGQHLVSPPGITSKREPDVGQRKDDDDKRPRPLHLPRNI